LVAAVTGADCNNAGEDCRVFITHGDGSPPEVVDSDGNREVAVPGAIKLNDVSATGLIATQTSSSDTGSCSAVHDGVQGAEVFATCDATLFAFSPDGRHLTGSDSYLDGIGLGYVTILDATNGEEVVRFSPKQGFVSHSVWEDDSHVLVNAYEQGEWRIYRLGVDGTTEEVLSSTEGDDMTPVFTLLGAS
jgi:WD40 repeat protein